MSSDTDYGAGWDAGYEAGFKDAFRVDLTDQQAKTLEEMHAWFLNYNREGARGTV